MSKKYKLLFVDDEPDLKPLVLQRFRRDIRKGHYECIFAQNGVEALECIIEHDDLDLVVSDINMPEMDGLTLLTKISKVKPDLKSIIVSAYGDMKNIRKAMNFGAFDFIVKPIDFEDLRLTISRTLEHVEAWREAQSSKVKLVSISKELQIANKMQQSILPSKLPEGDNFKFFGYMEPARNIGGDFYDVIPLPDGKIAIAVADVSDKGVPAALFMMASKTILKGSSLSKVEPSTVLNDVNDYLYGDNNSNMFVTLIYGVIDTETGTFDYANGGHNPPVIVHEDGNAEYVEMPKGLALGMFPGFEFKSSRLQLGTGDTLILYTDGITEAQDSVGELYGEDRLLQAINLSVREKKENLMESVVDSVNEFSKGELQTDDMTYLEFNFNGTK